MSTTAEHRLENEAVLVWSWRYVQALEAGLEPDDANRFASSTVDVEAPRTLARRGCPPELIARILL